MKSTNTIEAKRFKQLRIELGYTQQAFANILEIGSTTADIERSKTKITGKVVAELMSRFNINPLWLYGESDNKYVTASTSDVSPKVVTLDATGSENMVMVNQKAAAGYPHNVQDADWYQSLPRFNIPLPQFRNATYRGFQLECDIMLPNIKPDECVLGRAVETIESATDGRIYIVVLKDSVLVKKLQKLPHNQEKIRLISLNPEYLPIEVKVSEIQELWMVNSKISFGVEEPSDSNLLRQLHESMEELKGQLRGMQ